MDNSEKSSIKPKRLFIGISIPVSPELKNHIIGIKSLVAENAIKWSDFQNYHITIRFLGHQPDYYTNSLIKILEAAAKDINRFDFNLVSLGYFGKDAKPRILWMGCKPVETLNKVYAILNEKLDIVGLKNESGDYNPHLTLGRIKKVNPIEIANLIAQHESIVFQQINVSKILLFESISGKEGVRYEVIKSCELK